MRNRVTSLVWHTVSYQKLIYKWLQCNIRTWHKRQVYVSNLMSKWSWGQHGLLSYLHVMNSWSMETVTWGHVLIQKLPASVLALVLFTHTRITVRTDARSAFFHWRNKQQPEFPVCYFQCLQNKMFIYIKPWLFLYPCSLTASPPFFFLSVPQFSVLTVHPQPHTSVIIKPSAGRSEAQHEKTTV